MTRYLLRALLTLAFLALAPPFVRPTSAQETDLKGIVREAQGAVVSLEGFGVDGQPIGSGTGFFIQSGVVATNFHVIRGARSMKATLEDGQEVEVAGVLTSSESSDLALLSVPEVDSPALPIAGRNSVEPGDRVVVVGNPLGLSHTVSDGLVAALRPDGLGPDSEHFAEIPLIQVTAPISPGSSGSPVLDFDGQVVGVAVGAMVFGQNLNFAIPSSSLLDLLAGSDLESLERPFSSPSEASRWPLIRNLLISALFFAAVVVGIRLMRD